MDGWRTKVDAVTDELARRIAEGDLEHARTLPSERALARLLGTSRATVREALQRLKARGLVVIEGGFSTWAREEGDAATVHALPDMLVGRNGSLVPRGPRLLKGLFGLEVLMTLEAVDLCLADASPKALEALEERCLQLRWHARKEKEPRLLLRAHYDVLSAAICATGSISLLLLFNALEAALREALPHFEHVITPEPLLQLADTLRTLVQQRDGAGVRTTLASLLHAEVARRLEGLRRPGPSHDELLPEG